MRETRHSSHMRNSAKLANILNISAKRKEHNFPSDHYTIEFLIRTKFRKAKPVRRTVYGCNRANFPELCKALSQTDLRVSLSDNINDCWKHWKDLFLSVVSSYVPSYVSSYIQLSSLDRWRSSPSNPKKVHRLT
jgi:hypothetical protein